MNTEIKNTAVVVEKGLCEECSYYRELQYKPELEAHLCDQCYDLPVK